MMRENDSLHQEPALAAKAYILTPVVYDAEAVDKVGEAVAAKAAVQTLDQSLPEADEYLVRFVGSASRCGERTMPVREGTRESSFVHPEFNNAEDQATDDGIYDDGVENRWGDAWNRPGIEVALSEADLAKWGGIPESLKTYENHSLDFFGLPYRRFSLDDMTGEEFIVAMDESGRRAWKFLYLRDGKWIPGTVRMLLFMSEPGAGNYPLL